MPDTDTDTDCGRPDLHVERSDDGDGWIVVHCDGPSIGDAGGEIVWMDRADAQRVANGFDLPWEPNRDGDGLAPIGGWADAAEWDGYDCDDADGDGPVLDYDCDGNTLT